MQLRYANEVAGGVLLLLLATGLAALVWLTSDRWREPKPQLRVQLPPSGAHGLLPDSEVRMLGTLVGQVLGIQVSPEGRMTAEISVDPRYLSLVRQDSEVLLRRELSLVSRTFVEISVGVGDALAGELPSLQARAEPDLQTLARDLLEKIELRLLPAMDAVQAAAEQLAAPDGRLQQLLQRYEQLGQRLEQGEGLVARLISDPQLLADVESLLGGADRTLNRLQQVLATAEGTGQQLSHSARQFDQRLEALDPVIGQASAMLQETRSLLEVVRQVAEPLPPLSETLGSEAVAMSGLLMQTTVTLEALEQVLMGLQRHWLLRSAMPDERPPARLPLEAVAMPGDEP